MNALAAIRASITRRLPNLPDCFHRGCPVELTAVPRILIVDDNVDYCAILKAWIEGDGMEAVAVHTIRDAKERVDTNGIDMVILDLRFPGESEGGLDFLHWAYNKHPDLMIIVCSGEPGYITGALNELASLDAITLLYKPLRREQLLRVLNRFLSYGMHHHGELVNRTEVGSTKPDGSEIRLDGTRKAPEPS